MLRLDKSVFTKPRVRIARVNTAGLSKSIGYKSVSLLRH